MHQQQLANIGSYLLSKQATPVNDNLKFNSKRVCFWDPASSRYTLTAVAEVQNSALLRNVLLTAGQVLHNLHRQGKHHGEVRPESLKFDE